MELDSHADTAACGSNCVIIHCTGQECDVSPCTDTHEAIKSVPVVQAATARDNPDTGETCVLSLNQAIWMGDKISHALVNPNQLRARGITVQDNPFIEAPMFLPTEDNNFSVPLACKGAIPGVATRTPTEQELQTCPHVAPSSDHEWDPQNVRFPKASRTVEEEISRSIGSIVTQSETTPEDDAEDVDSQPNLMLDVGGLSKRLIASVKVVARQVSQVEVEIQDAPQAKSFQSEGRHSSVTPEDSSERWQIGLEQAKRR
jgi:hypothetical protein